MRLQSDAQIPAFKARNAADQSKDLKQLDEAFQCSSRNIE